MSGSSDSKSPDWAIERARASLKLGMKAPEIEKGLIAHGLAAQGATAAVEKALEDQVRQQFISKKAIAQRILAHRILSGIVGCICVGLGYWLGGCWAALRTCQGILLPLACIWFGDAMGAYWSAWSFNRPTPGVMVRVGGWIVLLMVALYLLELVLMLIFR